MTLHIDGDVDGDADGEQRRLAFAEIAKAKVQIEFNRKSRESAGHSGSHSGEGED